MATLMFRQIITILVIFSNLKILFFGRYLIAWAYSRGVHGVQPLPHPMAVYCAPIAHYINS